jgi:hypothetical protein
MSILFLKRYRVCVHWANMQQSYFDSRQGQRDLFSPQNAQTDSRNHPDFYSVSTKVLSRRSSGQGEKLNTQLYLVPKLRMSGPTPLYAFVV